MANIQLNHRNIRDVVLRGRGTANFLKKEADRVAATAGPGHETDVEIGPNRARAAVWTATFEARRREAISRNLTRALMGGAPELVSYTTAAGRTRLATRAQVANWTRGRQAAR